MAEKPYPSPSNLTEQSLNLCWRLATEMRAVYNTVKTKISKEEADAAYLAVDGKAVSASIADAATKATQDASGNVITSTYALKSAIPTVMTGASSSAAGKAGTVPAPAAGNQAKYLRGDGTWQTPPDTTYTAMKGASSSAAGSAGLVPTPSAGSQEKFLRGDGTWQAQVNADWNATSGASVINNKPTIPTKVSQLTNDSGYYKTSGGALNSGAIISRVTSGTSWIGGRNGALIKNTTAPGSSWGAITSSKSTNGSWETGVLGDNYYITYASDANFNAGTNSTVFGIVVDSSGNVTVGGSSLTVGGSAVRTMANTTIPTKTSALTNDSGFVKVTYGTSDLTAGSSSLTTGQVYLVYE